MKYLFSVRIKNHPWLLIRSLFANKVREKLHFCILSIQKYRHIPIPEERAPVLGRALKFLVFFSVFTFFAMNIVYSMETEKKMNSEFDIFDNKTEKENSETNNNSGLQIDLVIQKQFPRVTNFIPDPEFAALDSWIFTEYLRYSNQSRISNFSGFNLDMGLRNTTNSRHQTLNVLKNFNGASEAVNGAHPMYEKELSFFHFYLYEVSGNFEVSLSDKDTIFLNAGVLPVKFGNSFYKNPVSFFERYLPPREYIQEYNPLSLPGIKLGYIHEIYRVDVLFIPYIPYQRIGKNNEAKDFSEYFYFVNRANILMAKNSIVITDFQIDLYFFWENNVEGKKGNFFGFGPELNWRILYQLNLDWQILASNGKTLHEISKHTSNNSVYYSFEPLINSNKVYRIESLVALNFSGFINYEVSLGYYYNGSGLSKKQYNSLTDTLEELKNSYSSNASLKPFHLLFISSVLAQNDPFSLNQHYLFLNIVNLQNMDIITWGLSAFYTLELPSIMAVLFINFNVNNNTKFYFQLTGMTGLPHSVFAESPLAGSINGGVQWNF